MVELRRVLRPGGRLVMTSWDYHAQPVGRPPRCPITARSPRPRASRSLAYEDTDHWRERVLGTGLGLRDAVEELAAEDGVPVEELRAGLDQMLATYETMTRQFLLVAEAR